jgi:hypothetical protein
MSSTLGAGRTGGNDIEMERHSTHGGLIAADKVEGSAVYNPQGERLGTIETVMLDKIRGNAAYAVLSFGGFLGIGSRHYPLPWATLKYDTRLGGYVVNLDRSRLESAPSYADDEAVTWEDEAWGQRVHDYYGTEPYWR